MKILESKPKAGIYTLLVYFLIMAEMGILSGFRFCVPTEKYFEGLTKLKVNDLSGVGATVGWNFIVVSCVIILALIGFSMLLGYNRNPAGMIALVIMNFIPMIGLVYNFNFFYGYGTSHFLPAMSIFGLHRGDRVGQIIFIAVISVLIIAFWFIGKHIRSIYAAKYEIEY